MAPEQSDTLAAPFPPVEVIALREWVPEDGRKVRFVKFRQHTGAAVQELPLAESADAPQPGAIVRLVVEMFGKADAKIGRDGKAFAFNATKFRCLGYVAA